MPVSPPTTARARVDTCIIRVEKESGLPARPEVVVVMDPWRWSEMRFTPFVDAAAPTVGTGDGGSDDSRGAGVPVVHAWEPEPENAAEAPAAEGSGVGSTRKNPRTGVSEAVENHWNSLVSLTATGLAITLPRVVLDLTDSSYAALMQAMVAIETPASSSDGSSSSGGTSTSGAPFRTPAYMHPSRATLDQVLIAIRVNEGAVTFFRDVHRRSLSLFASHLTTVVAMPLNAPALLDVAVVAGSLALSAGAADDGGVASGAMKSCGVVLHRTPTAPSSYSPEPMLVVRVCMRPDRLHGRKTDVVIGALFQRRLWCDVQLCSRCTTVCNRWPACAAAALHDLRLDHGHD